MTTDTRRKHNFCSVEFDVSLAQVRALDAYLAQSTELARMGKLNRAQFTTLLSIQLEGLANGDAGVEAKLFRAMKHLMDHFYIKETPR